MARSVKWKPVLDEYGHRLEGYEVSDDGRVRSYWGRGPQGLVATSKELKFWQDKYGRLLVELRSPKRSKARYMVHRLVATAFVRQPTEEHSDVVHLDKDMSNNDSKNLAWMTKVEVADHAAKSKNRWARQGGAPKLTLEQINEIIESEMTREQVAKKFGISERQVSQVRNGHTGLRVKQSRDED